MTAAHATIIARMDRTPALDVNPRKVAPRLPTTYAHIGVYDVCARRAFAARNDAPIPAIDQSHVGLFLDGGPDALVVKDRFMCHWFYPPGTRDGLVQGYSIDWREGNLLVRLEPHWSYLRQKLVPAHETAAIEANVAQQLRAAAHLLRLYGDAGLRFPLSLHMVGPRTADSLFQVERWEPQV